MSNIEDLVRTTGEICHNIDMIIKMERRMNVELLCELERMSWDMLGHMENLKQIKERFGE